MATKDVQAIFKSMEYGPAPESRLQVDEWLAQHAKQFDLFINGKWVKPSKGKYFFTKNPAKNEKIAKLAEADKTDVNKAVKAATLALSDWQKIGGHARAQYLYAIARHIQKHARLFAVLESLDNGKPIRESRDIDIPLVARHFYYHAGWAQLMATELPDYEAIGVIGQIIPWNFPLLMLAWKIAPALAMGNTVVLKPAEFTSLTALLFAEICQQVGLPKGVINIVTGFGATGEAIVNHPDIHKIAFTGSTEVGKLIRRATAGTGKKLSLELGGKSPFIVFEDSDLDSVVEGLVDAIWFNQGQVCCAGSRLLVQESIAEKLLTKIKARLEKFKLGDPLDKGIDMGCIVDPSQLSTIKNLVAQAEQEGVKKWQPASWSCPENGCYFPPTLFYDVAPAASIAQVEIFGPVLVAMTFRTPSEAVTLANNTRYGLAASIWTENINLALDIAPKIKAGSVWVNCSNVFDAAAGFGGYRESGFGREGGLEGLYEYIQPKFIKNLKVLPSLGKVTFKQVDPNSSLPNNTIDRTAKLYIGGKQVRPDSGYSYVVYDNKKHIIGEAPLGNRKDIRNAVEATHKAQSIWQATTAHNRAQILYYIAENLSARGEEFIKLIIQTTNCSKAQASNEVKAAINLLFTYAAFSDKYDGYIHHTPLRNITLAMPEAIGVLGIRCPSDSALLGFIATIMPVISMGNAVVAIPSENYPLVVTNFYQVLDTSDLPAGVINIITGNQDELAENLALHDDVDGLWYFGSAAGSKMIESLAADNMKRCFVNYGEAFDWANTAKQARFFLRQATQIKNIWVPYGE